MDFSINSFITNVAGAGGLAKTNRFKVEFGEDRGWGNSGNTPVEFWCQSAELPGRNFNSTDARIYGPTYKVPTESLYQEINLSFLCDVSMNQKLYFDNWMNFINPSQDISSQKYSSYRGFDFMYKDDYVLPQVIIKQISENGTTMYAVKLFKVFPTSVAHLQTNWQDDGFHHLNVTLAYDYWDLDYVPIQVNQNLNILNDGKDDLFGGIANKISSIKGIAETVKKGSDTVSAVKSKIEKAKEVYQKAEKAVSNVNKAVNNINNKINQANQAVAKARSTVAKVKNLPTVAKNKLTPAKNLINSTKALGRSVGIRRK